MSTFQQIQEVQAPSWNEEVRLVYLTFRSDEGRTVRCQTLAASLEEAVARARTRYGPGEMLSWGTRKLPIESLLLGGGEVLRGCRDHDHLDDFIRLRP